MIIKKKTILRKIEDELWKAVPNSNNRYYVSNYGRVKTFAYKKEGQIMKCKEINSFKGINLKINKINRLYYLHKLVAEIWLPKPSEQHTYVAHLDGNLTNNQILNLKWLTKEELTIQHREFKANNKSPKKPVVISNSKLKVKDVIHIKKMLQKGVSQIIIAKMFRISDMQVSRIKRGENWGHVQVEVAN